MVRARWFAVLVATVVAGVILSSPAMTATVGARPALQDGDALVDLPGLATYPLDTGDDDYVLARGVRCLTPATCADPSFFGAETEESLTEAGLEQAYALALVKYGDDDIPVRQILATTLAQYSDEAGAETGVTTFLAWLADPFYEEAVSQEIGENAQLYNIEEPLPGDPSSTGTVGVRFRVGTVVAGIEIRDYTGTPIDTGTVESLAADLAERIEAADQPSLTNLTVHHRAAATEYYAHLDGTTIPLAGETVDQREARASEFERGSVQDVSLSNQALVAGDDPNAPELSLFVTLYLLPSESEASDFLFRTSNNFAAERERVGGATVEPEEPPALGDEAVWFLNVYSDAYQAMGYVRVGDIVARVIWQANQTVNAGDEADLLERAESDLLPGAAYTAEQQVNCLRDGGCPGVTRLPSRYLP